MNEKGRVRLISDSSSYDFDRRYAPRYRSACMLETKSLEAICADLAAGENAWAAVRSGSHYVPLLPLLEHHYVEVDATLVGCLMAAGIPRVEAAELSLTKLVVFALTADIGRGWALNAVNWVMAGFPIDENVATALERLAQQKRFPQRTRHQAFAAAKRWRRAQRTVGHLDGAS